MSETAHAERLESVSVILPVVNETTALEQTVRIILRDVPRQLIRELLIVVCRRTTAASMQTIADLQRRLGDLVVVVHQKLPYLGGALRDAFKVARGSHVIIMASDMETLGAYSDGKESQRKTYETAAWIGYGLGAACVVTGAFLYYLGLRSSNRGSRALSLLPALAPNQAGAALAGEF